MQSSMQTQSRAVYRTGKHTVEIAEVGLDALQELRAVSRPDTVGALNHVLGANSILD